MIHVDGLGSGTVKKNTALKIANVDGVYAVTADATISTNECDIYISPGLAVDVADGVVVTLETSTLSDELESMLIESIDVLKRYFV